MGPVVSLRPFTSADDGFLLAVFADTRERELALLPLSDEQKAMFLVTQWDAKLRSYRAAHQGAHERVIVSDGRDVGYLIWSRPDGGSMWIVDIAISASWRNQGIGTRVLDRVLADADREGAAVALHVDVGSPAHELYRRLGFVDVAVGELHIEMRRPARTVS
jgi:GNAT superfamily N-acetyltransferase